jgi:hypothetical protein
MPAIGKYFILMMARLLRSLLVGVRLPTRGSAQRAARTVLFALAFLSLGSVLLRPFCEFPFSSDRASGIVSLFHAGGHAAAENLNGSDAPSETCCDSVKDDTLLTAAEPSILRAQGGTLAVLVFVSAGLLPFARPRHPTGRFLPALPERSFYARSARILR